MKKLITMAAAVAATTLFAPALAQAQDADTTADLHMRAGPDTAFPVVTTIPEGRTVDLHGCVQGYEWCDVSWRGRRGWVFADYLTYPYNGRRVPVIEYGSRIDLPVIGFSIGSYWNSHYHNEPWYDERDRWRNRFQDQPWFDGHRRHNRRGDRDEDRDHRRGDRWDRDRDHRDGDRWNRDRDQRRGDRWDRDHRDRNHDRWDRGDRRNHDRWDRDRSDNDRNLDNGRDRNNDRNMGRDRDRGMDRDRNRRDSDRGRETRNRGQDQDQSADDAANANAQADTGLTGNADVDTRAGADLNNRQTDSDASANTPGLNADIGGRTDL